MRISGFDRLLVRTLRLIPMTISIGKMERNRLAKLVKKLAFFKSSVTLASLPDEVCLYLDEMGLLKDDAVLYKPLDQMDFGPHRDEVYLYADVKAPRMAGTVAKIFVWFLEMTIIGVLLYFLKKNNRIQKVLLVPTQMNQFCTVIMSWYMQKNQKLEKG